MRAHLHQMPSLVFRAPMDVYWAKDVVARSRALLIRLSTRKLALGLGVLLFIAFFPSLHAYTPPFTSSAFRRHETFQISLLMSAWLGVIERREILMALLHR